MSTATYNPDLKHGVLAQRAHEAGAAASTFLGRALVARADELASAIATHRPVGRGQVDAVEVLLERVRLFQQVHDLSARRLAGLAQAVRGCGLDRGETAAAIAQLERLGRLLRELDAGRFEADDFLVDFTAGCDRLDQLVIESVERNRALQDHTT